MKRIALLPFLLALGFALAGCPSSSPYGIWLDGKPQEDGGGLEVLPTDDVVVGPAGCESNDDCPSGVCNPFSHTCVDCMTDNDCGDTQYCDKFACYDLPSCADGELCPEGLVCLEEEGVCVECIEDSDCAVGECIENECLLPCGAGCPDGLVCDELSGYCVECLSDGDCLLEEWCFTIQSECVDDQCVPGALGCVGNKTAVCADNGSGWTGLEACPKDYVCVDGACQDLQICEPGLISCKDEHTIHICSEDGTKLKEEPCPEGLWCKGGKCVEECVPDCDGKECGPSNCPGYSCGECPEGTHCDGGQCLPGFCVEGEKACMGNTVVYCLGPEVGWSEGKPCPPNTQCIDGECIGTEPTECAAVLDCMMQFAVEEPDPFFMEKCFDETGPSDIAMEIFFCVFETCGVWNPGSTCFKKALESEMCGWLYDECMGGCQPNCWNKECGGDGCGGSCGVCPPGLGCNNGKCQPQGGPSCGEVIGCMMDFPCPDPDGWGCLMECSQGQEPPEMAVEVYYCVVDVCGIWMPWDECFGFALKEACGDLYMVCLDECQPNCWNKECGGDGCGGSCGMCPAGESCSNGKCIPGGETECGEILDCMLQDQCVGPEPWWCLDMCVGPNQDPPDVLFQLFDCVMAFCGEWFPYDECFKMAIGEFCWELYDECVGGGCQPQCAGKACGPDGCGGLCGKCPSGLQCTPAGKCEKPCQPSCVSPDGTLKECGGDGCGGSCGVCPVGSSCDAAGHCIQTCQPKCAGKACGSDGCGGSCGLCANDEACKNGQCVPSLTCQELTECIWDCPPYGEQCQNQCYVDASPAAKQQWAVLVQCIQEVCGPNAGNNCIPQAIQGPCKSEWNACQECTPECIGKKCGPDGCGGQCGQCPSGYVCDNWGSCLCQPQCAGKECGNGSCGSCKPGEVCNAWGFCLCTPKCDGKQCGPDGCGGSCGKCPVGSVCTALGTCESTGPGQCGNGKCQPGQGESCETCPQDCPCEDSCCEVHEFPGCNEPETMKCVCEMDPFCCEQMWDGLCVDEAIDMCKAKCSGGCKPNCLNKECGSDGCGGSCGTCPAGSTCNAGGICEQTCKPNCLNKECGSDGCGGSCGLCGAGEACKSGACIPSLSCEEMLYCLWSCPPNDEACSSACWTIASPAAKQQWYAVMGCIGEFCGDPPEDQCWQEAVQGPCKEEWYACQECTADCVGKQCGDDGCGGTCGQCPGGYACDPFGSCLCQPQCAGKVCGNDGCGGSCGTCPAGNVCNYQGKCVCMPQCDGKECGSDGCGGTCGTCPPGLACSPAGICQEPPDQCGNNWCQPGQGENCESCPEDCGPCQYEGDCCFEHDNPGCEDPEVTACVCEMDPFCCNNYWDSVCVSEAKTQCKAWCPCTPSCQGKQCGGDGCGGSCGTCPPGTSCTDAGQCVPGQDSCGNGWCQQWQGETCETCPEDCGSCGCGDGLCAADEGEDCSNCPEDCGPCNEGDCCTPKQTPGCEVAEVVECVCAMDPYCCQTAWDGICVNEAQQDCGYDCGGPCEPQCVSSDGQKKECGSDGCGGVCGYCPEGIACVNGMCQGGCVPNCTVFGFPKQCGDDGCGGSCGTCPNGTQCDLATFQCVDICIPNCQGKECGSDGCGGICGACAPGEQCTNGQCIGTKSCSDMVDCAIDCGFAMNCAWGCMSNGDQQSQQLFQQLALCVVQSCGLNVNVQCVIQSFQGACASQYSSCANDQ
jgi:hypothetical protein